MIFAPTAVRAYYFIIIIIGLGLCPRSILGVKKSRDFSRVLQLCAINASNLDITPSFFWGGRLFFFFLIMVKDTLYKTAILTIVNTIQWCFSTVMTWCSIMTIWWQTSSQKKPHNKQVHANLSRSGPWSH